MEFLLRRASRLAFWLCAAAVLYLALSPVSARETFAQADKLEHVFAFFVLASLGSLAWPGWPRQLLLGLAAYGVLIELLQLLTPDHHADLLDVMADLAGAVLAMGLFTASRLWVDRAR